MSSADPAHVTPLLGVARLAIGVVVLFGLGMAGFVGEGPRRGGEGVYTTVFEDVRLTARHRGPSADLSAIGVIYGARRRAHLPANGLPTNGLSTDGLSTDGAVVGRTARAVPARQVKPSELGLLELGLQRPLPEDLTTASRKNSRLLLTHRDQAIHLPIAMMVSTRTRDHRETTASRPPARSDNLVQRKPLPEQRVLQSL